MSNSLNLNSAYYNIFTKLSMIAYVNKFQKSSFAYISFRQFDQSEPGRKIKLRVYFHPVGYMLAV